MADDIDMRDLLAGDRDMVARNLDGADLRGMDLRDRDFTRCKFSRADLREANFAEAVVQATNFSRADLTGANLTAVSGQMAVFSRATAIGAILVGADLRSANFRGANLTGADLRGTSFANAKLDDAIFDDTLTDTTTDFNGAVASRSLAQHPVFRGYTVRQGKLVRRPNDELVFDGNSVYDEAVYDTPGRMAAGTAEFVIGTPTISSSHRSEYPEIVAAIDKLLTDLKAMTPPSPANQAPHGGIGHNGPPDDYPLDREEHDDLVAALTAVRVELHSGDVRREAVEAAAHKFDSAGWQIAKWVGRKADLAADEFAKNIGKNLADGRHLMAGYMIVSGQLANLSQALTALLGGLTH